MGHPLFTYSSKAVAQGWMRRTMSRELDARAYSDKMGDRPLLQQNGGDMIQFRSAEVNGLVDQR